MMNCGIDIDQLKEFLRLTDQIKNNYRALKKAKEKRCTCTGIVLQVDGCSCEKAAQIKLYSNNLNYMLDQL